jgi:hypothetical protein
VGGVPSRAAADVQAEHAVTHLGGETSRVALSGCSRVRPSPLEPTLLVDCHGSAVHAPRCYGSEGIAVPKAAKIRRRGPGLRE